MTAQRVPRFAWLRPLTAVLDHLAERPAPTASRFVRVEAPVSISDLTAARRAPHTPRAGDGQATVPGAPGSGARGTLLAADGIPPRSIAATTHGAPTAPASGASPEARAGDGQPARGPLLPPHTAGPNDTTAPATPIPPAPIPPAARTQLEDLLGAGAPAARVHTDAAADQIARAERADAVTVGQDIYFRRDAYRPQTVPGFALLTHEVVHVLQAMAPGAAWHRATAPGLADEERAAETAEALALRQPGGARVLPTGLPPGDTAPSRPRQGAPLMLPHLPSARLRPAAPPPSVTEAGAGAAMPPTAHRPMTAATGRTLDAPAPAAPASADLDALRRTLYRDLMQQIKADAERGG